MVCRAAAHIDADTLFAYFFFFFFRIFFFLRRSAFMPRRDAMISPISPRRRFHFRMPQQRPAARCAPRHAAIFA
jgi:hypothetical protein